ncbi:MAG: hypothetical protein COB66_01145 [Coxiella sp. (in: Bacteria)]|nr:MAG: hypothetical protein COB66_01145 [Coxiella sp. (in: g-proteobacteria)]
MDEIYNLFSMDPNEKVPEDLGNAFRHFENFRSLFSKPINTKNPKARTAIEVPDKVTSIGRFMFRDCSALSSIYIPASVMSIDSRAFDYCNSLTSISCTLQVLSLLPEGLKHQLKSITIISGLAKTPENESIDRTNNFYYWNLESIKISAKVKSIGASAFVSCTSLTSIELPQSVTSIGTGAFRYCGALASIEIPGGVRSIGATAFSGCGLTSIEIPGGVTSIEGYAFSGCSALTSIEIPDSVTSIGESAFSHCSALTSIEIPDSVTSIGEDAFSHCSALTSINIRNSVTSIKWSAFNNCNSLTSMSCTLQVWSRLPQLLKRQLNSITIIPESAELADNESINHTNNFGDCSNLESIKISVKVTSIGAHAFSDCSALTSIEIPDSVTSIGAYAFDSCNVLASIELPQSVTSIGAGAFRFCRALTSIEIPGGVKSIGVDAFKFCSALTSIEIPDSVTSIGEDAFSGCSKLTSIEIPDGVTSIEVNAFNGCSALTAINITKSVTSIGRGAFYNCSALTSIEIPGGVRSIRAYAFSDCSALTSIEIPSGVTLIEVNAFRDCAALTSIEIPDSVTSIEWYAFHGCSVLTSIEIPSGVRSIGGYAFSGCSALTSIKLPDSVKSIGVDAFSGCSALTSINIPNSVTLIERGAFDDCKSLTSISCTLQVWSQLPQLLKSQLKSITLISKSEELADNESINNTNNFRDCLKLKSIQILAEVTWIGDDAFRGCSALTAIDIPSGVTSIGNRAFQGCSALESIAIPKSVTLSGDGVFDGCSALTDKGIKNDSHAFSLSENPNNPLNSIRVGDSMSGDLFSFPRLEGNLRLTDMNPDQPVAKGVTRPCQVIYNDNRNEVNPYDELYEKTVSLNEGGKGQFPFSEGDRVEFNTTSLTRGKITVHLLPPYDDSVKRNKDLLQRVNRWAIDKRTAAKLSHMTTRCFSTILNKFNKNVLHETIINRLTQYVERIDRHQMEPNGQGNPDFKYGFSLFPDDRGKNRQANYLLVKALLRGQVNNCFENTDIFSKENIAQLRDNIISDENIFPLDSRDNRGINSYELNAILDFARDGFDFRDDAPTLLPTGWSPHY